MMNLVGQISSCSSSSCLKWITSENCRKLNCQNNIICLCFVDECMTTWQNKTKLFFPFEHQTIHKCSHLHNTTQLCVSGLIPLIWSCWGVGYDYLSFDTHTCSCVVEVCIQMSHFSCSHINCHKCTFIHHKGYISVTISQTSKLDKKF